RSCLYKRGMTDKDVYRAIMDVLGITDIDVIEKHLSVNNTFKGYVAIYYELHAQTNIVTIDDKHPFYMWNESDRLWIHCKNQKVASSTLYTDFSDFMENLLYPYAQLQEDSQKKKIILDALKSINNRAKCTDLEMWLLKRCQDTNFINLIRNV